jgi:hypothetical protein
VDLAEHPLSPADSPAVAFPESELPAAPPAGSEPATTAPPEPPEPPAPDPEPPTAGEAEPQPPPEPEPEPAPRPEPEPPAPDHVAAECPGYDDLTEDQRNARGALQYTDRSPRRGEFCHNCALVTAEAPFRPCMGCRVLPGPVAPRGWCRAWAAAEG